MPFLTKKQSKELREKRKNIMKKKYNYQHNKHSFFTILCFIGCKKASSAFDTTNTINSDNNDKTIIKYTYDNYNNTLTTTFNKNGMTFFEWKKAGISSKGDSIEELIGNITFDLSSIPPIDILDKGNDFLLIKMGNDTCLFDNIEKKVTKFLFM